MWYEWNQYLSRPPSSSKMHLKYEVIEMKHMRKILVHTCVTNIADVKDVNSRSRWTAYSTARSPQIHDTTGKLQFFMREQIKARTAERNLKYKLQSISLIGVWWLSGKFNALHAQSRRFEPHYSRYVGTWASPSLEIACMMDVVPWVAILQLNSTPVTSVHTLLINILRCVRLYIQRKYYIIFEDHYVAETVHVCTALWIH